jgi:large exoprotein involved in heme utilization and adhesion
VLENISRIASSNNRNGSGNIQIQTRDLNVLSGSSISTTASGSGSSGSLTIEAAESVTLLGSELSEFNGDTDLTVSSLSTTNQGVGRPGNLTINTRRLSVRDGASITATSGSASTQNQLMTTNPPGSSSPTTELTINALESVGIAGVANTSDGPLPANIATSTFNSNNAGNLTINTNNFTIGDNNFVNSGTFRSGRAGNLTINAQTIRSNGGSITSTTNGSGDAGRIALQAQDAIVLTGDSSVSTGVFRTLMPNNSQPSGGNILVRGRSLLLDEDSSISAESIGRGQAGAIELSTRDSITLRGGSSVSVSASGRAQGAGSIQMRTNNLSLSNLSVIRALTGSGLDGGEGQGNAGNISVSAQTIRITNGSRIETTSSASRGNAGNITIRANDLEVSGFFRRGSEFALNSAISAGVRQNTTNTRGGTITVNTNRLRLLNGGRIDTDVISGAGRAGNVIVRATDTIEISGVGARPNNPSGLSSAVQTGANGTGGSIQVGTRRLNLSDRAEISTSTFARGNAGNIRINAERVNLFNNSFIQTQVGPRAEGDSGAITISAQRLLVRENSQIGANVLGRGNAGSVTVRAGEIELIDVPDPVDADTGISATVLSGAAGNAGDVVVEADRLTIRSGAVIGSEFGGERGGGGNVRVLIRDDLQILGGGRRSDGESIVGGISTGTFSKGDAGDIFVQSSNIFLQGGYIISSVFTGGQGRAGDVEIQTNNLTLLDGAGVRAGVNRSRRVPPNNVLVPAGRGQGGNIRINAANSILVSGFDSDGLSSSIGAATERGARGNAGNITLTTGDLILDNGGLIAARTLNNSNAGSITVNANNLFAINGGQILTSTTGSGAAGSIRLDVAEAIQLSGTDPNFAERLQRTRRFLSRPANQNDRPSDIIANPDPSSGLFANTTPGSSGNGGSIFVNGRSLTLQNGSRIAVDSQGRGQGGDLAVRVNTAVLNNRSQISAETASADGGDIGFNARDVLVLRNGSSISTTAGTTGAGGNGGNININTGFLVAAPNESSTIRANAFTGRGGNVQIDAQGVFGILSSDRPLPGISTITASSERGVQGQIEINTPTVDPSQGLTELPVDLADVSNQINRSCTIDSADNQLGQFTVSGRGSLPASPVETLTGETVITQLATLEEESSQSTSIQSSQSPAEHQRLVEAQGWVRGADGTISLFAAVPASSAIAPANCLTHQQNNL